MTSGLVGLENKLKIPVICTLQPCIRCGSVDYQDFHLSESVTKIGNNLNIICNTDIIYLLKLGIFGFYFTITGG